MPGRVIRYVARAVALPAVIGPDGKPIRFGRLFFPDLLWMVVPHLRTSKLVARWMSAVETLPEQHRERFWGGELGRQGVHLVPNKAYLSEYEKPAAEQDWEALMSACRELRDRARKIGQPRLEATATRMVLCILGDLKRTAELAPAAQETLDHWPAEPTVQFLVHGTLGQQYTNNKRHDLARTHLETAFSHPGVDNHHEQLRYLIAASQSFGTEDPAAGVRYAEQARNLARTSDRLPPSRLPRRSQSMR